MSDERAVRVAVCGRTIGEARALRRAACDPDLRVIAAVEGVGDLERLLARQPVEVVVVAGDLAPSRTARALKEKHPCLKVVGVADPDDGDVVDRWAGSLTEVPSAVLTSFLY